MKKEKNLDDILASEFSEDVLDLKQKLKVITQRKNMKKGKILKIVIPLLSIAAALLLAAIIIPSLYNADASSKLYDSYYETYPMALNQRGDTDPMLNQAISNYTDGNYVDALQKFKILYTKSGNTLYLLYAGSAEQAQGNYQLAIDLYDQVIVNNDPKVVEQATWYKALALLELENFEFAKEILSSFQESHYKYIEAKEILKKIE